MKHVGKWKVCSRGHKFFKSSDCPVCPICWSGYYKEKLQSDFPTNLGAPVLRAFANEKIAKLSQVSKYSEKEILKLHGVGPSAIPKLKKALKEKGLKFKE